MFQEMIRQIQRAETISYTGKIENIVGMSIEASGGRAAVGDICQIYNGDAGGQVMAEVVGFKNDHILLMPYSDMSGTFQCGGRGHACTQAQPAHGPLPEGAGD